MLQSNQYVLNETPINDYSSRYDIYKNSKLVGWCITEFGKIKQIHTVSSINEILIENLISNLF